MISRKTGALLGLVAMLAACGGGGTGGGAPIGGGTPTPSPTPTACSLRDRQDWAFAQLKEWYLFPETLPTTLNPAPYTNVDDYIDALTATARSQRKDRYFTYMTSLADENAFYNSGTSGGFGFRLGLTSSNRLYILEAFEGAPALNAGIDRGAEIVSVGASVSSLQTIGNILLEQGNAGLAAALGGDQAGITRVFRISDASGVRNVTLMSTDYELTPVSSRYGVRVLDDGGRKVGYVNLRTFINPAGPALRSAFAGFKAQGITHVIVDLRYNGGGLVSIAQLLSNLLGGGRSGSDVMTYTSFRPEKSAENSTTFFAPQAESVAPVKIAFIGTGSSASASEFVINAFLPYLHANMALIGTNTYGKPVGQIAIDRTECNDRLRVVAFANQNAARQGDYYDGLARVMEATCQASDDISFPLGDARENSVTKALDFLAGRTCTRIDGASGFASQAAVGREMLTPARPNTAQREVPGSF